MIMQPYNTIIEGDGELEFQCVCSRLNIEIGELQAGIIGVIKNEAKMNNPDLVIEALEQRIIEAKLERKSFRGNMLYNKYN